jgi:HD superfamily phosphodiesterase
MQFDANKFEALIKPHILRCRDGDWNHALRVVGWVKKLGEKRNDLKLLITAAYIHDIGWRDILPKGKITLDKLLEFEQGANQNSKLFVANILREVGYTTEEINTANRLIKAADNHCSKTDDEAIIVDADNLSKLNIDHLKEKYQKPEWQRLYELWKKKFPKRIKTNKAKKLYPKLLEKLKQEIGNEG